MMNRGMSSNMINMMGRDMTSKMMNQGMSIDMMGRNTMGQDMTSKMMERNMVGQDMYSDVMGIENKMMSSNIMMGQNQMTLLNRLNQRMQIETMPSQSRFF